MGIKLYKNKQRKWRLWILLTLLTFITVAVWTLITTTQKAYRVAAKATTKAKETYRVIDSSFEADKKDTNNRRGYSLFAAYHIDKPDTKANRERYEDYIKLLPGNDVKNVYCSADFLGADYTIQMAFTCNKATVAAIVHKHGLTQLDSPMEPSFGASVDWWPTPVIAQLPTYKAGVEFEWFIYFWYNEQTGQAYFLQYSL